MTEISGMCCETSSLIAIVWLHHPKITRETLNVNLCRLKTFWGIVYSTLDIKDSKLEVATKEDAS